MSNSSREKYEACCQEQAHDEPKGPLWYHHAARR
jgi:hypothetical protein